MNYILNVVLAVVSSEKGLVGLEQPMELVASFSQNPKQYGNGYSLLIKDTNERFREVFDLRYEKDFDPNDKENYLSSWAENYWNGERGAYKLKKINITKV